MVGQVDASSARFYTSVPPQPSAADHIFYLSLTTNHSVPFFFASPFPSTVHCSSAERLTACGVPERALSPAEADDSSIARWHHDLTPLQRLTS